MSSVYRDVNGITFSTLLSASGVHERWLDGKRGKPSSFSEPHEMGALQVV